MYFWERKNGIRDSDEKVRDAGFSWKRRGNAGSGPPLPDPANKGACLYVSFWPQKILVKMVYLQNPLHPTISTEFSPHLTCAPGGAAMWHGYMITWDWYQTWRSNTNRCSRWYEASSNIHLSPWTVWLIPKAEMKQIRTFRPVGVVTLT